MVLRAVVGVVGVVAAMLAFELVAGPRRRLGIPERPRQLAVRELRIIVVLNDAGCVVTVMRR